MIPILYGSQTGNGEFLAGLLRSHIADTFGIEAFAAPIDSFDLYKIAELPFYVFICSTHGDGQCPFNMATFWRVINADLPPGIFKFQFAILGLGDSSYSHFAYCARMLHKRLLGLGAACAAMDIANTQDKAGIYDGYGRFVAHISGLIQQNRPLFAPHWEAIQAKLTTEHPGKGAYDYFTKGKTVYRASITSNTLLTPPDYDKPVIEIRLRIPEYTGFYPGDCIGIMPENDKKALGHFGYLPEDEQEWLRRNIDFNAVLHWPVLRELAPYATTEQHREKILELGADYDMYSAYAVEPRRTILETCEDLHIASVPFALLRRLNRIYPRYYSCTKLDGEYSILVSLVNYKTYLAEPRHGLCSEYLRDLSGEIDVEVTQSSLFFEARRLVFLSTGSGITLPRSVLHFFEDKEVVLYHGFRFYEKDQLCLGEFQGHELHLAASRDDKKYIMDVFKEHPVDGIDDALVFVSGNARLPKEIKKLFQEVYGRRVVFQAETW